MANPLNLFSLKIANTYVAGQTTTTDTFTIGQKSGYSLGLHALRYNRKLYQPGEIETEISIKPAPAVSDVVTAFLKQKVELTLVSANITIAKNYYVHELLPLEMKGDATVLYIKLLIYSMDKVMTLDKYSKVYVGKKLGSGILETEAKNFTVGTNAVSVSCENLRHLKYEQEMLIKKKPTETTDTNGGDDSIYTTIKIPSEFIQPYLVQYNESFYDFLARTANRCGEFLYFEDGQLNLGVPFDKKTGATAITNYASVTYQNVFSSSQSFDYFSRDSVKYGNGIKQESNSCTVEGNGAGFPEDVFPKEAVYNAELANDEYFYPLYADNFSSLNRELGYDRDAGVAVAADLFPDLSTIINSSDNVFQLLTNLADKKISDVKWAGISANGKNDGGNANYITPKKNTEHGNGEKTVEFGTLSPEGWTKLSYYQDVRKNAEEVQKGIVCIKVNPNFNTVKLGDKITIGTDTKIYVVIQIIMEGDRAWNCDYTMEEGGVTPDAGTPIQKIFAIPLTQDNKEVYPPVQPISAIRKSEPQTAFITDNKDPKYQGRVRIVYPWQSPWKESTVSSALETAQKNLKDAREALYGTDTKEGAEKKYKQAEQNYNEAKRLYEELNDTEKKNKAKERYSDEITSLETLKAVLEKAKTDGIKSENQEKWEKYFTDTWSTKIESSMTKEEFLVYIKSFTSEDLNTEIGSLADIIDKKQQYYNKYFGDNATESDINAEKERLRKEIEDDKNTDKKDSLKKIKEDAESTYRNAIQDVKNKMEALKIIAKEFKDMMKGMSSPWIRVSTPMATDGGGTYFRPNVGDEVLINYDSGNIERPYVVGSLFSKNLLEPNELASRTSGSGDASISIVSANGHGITFKDPSNGNKFLKSMFPMLNTALQYPDVSDDFGFPKEAAGGIRIGDRYGLYTIDMSSDKRSVKISSSMGTVSLNAFTGITISAPNGDVTIEGKNVNIKAGNNLSLTSGLNIEKGWLHYKKEKWAKEITGDITKVIAKNEFTPFLDLSLERQLIEVVLRPIEGTLCVKSKRYLKLEAGDGTATVAADQYKPTTTTLNEGVKYTVYGDLSMIIANVSRKLDGIAYNIGRLYGELETAKRAYEAAAPLFLEENLDVLTDAFNNQLSQWYNYDDEFNDKLKNSAVIYKNTTYTTQKEKNDQITTVANNFGRAVLELRKYINDLKAKYASLDLENLHVDSKLEKLAKKWFETICDEIQTEWMKATAINKRDAFFNNPNPPQWINKKVIKRKWAAFFIHDIAGKFGMLRIKPFIRANYSKSDIPMDLTNDQGWSNLMNNVDVKPNDSVGWIIGKSLVENSIGELLKSFNPKELYKTFIRNVWDDNKPGQILMSAKAGTTYTLDEDGKWKKKLDDSFETLKNKLINLA